MTKLPEWSTPERRKHLVSLYKPYGNQCLQGHRVCSDLNHYKTDSCKMEWAVEAGTKACVDADGTKTGQVIPIWKASRKPAYYHYTANLYSEVSEKCIEDWKSEDRERRNYEWKLEQLSIQDGTYGQFGSRFDPVSRDVFVNQRPTYYLVGMGVSPFTYKRVALVRIPSMSHHLFVDVSPATQEVSKNAKRKAMRHGKIRNGVLMERIHEMCQLAVDDWWSTKAVAA